MIQRDYGEGDKQVLSEVNAMRSVKGFHIIKFRELFQDFTNNYIVMTYYNKHNLTKHLANDSFRKNNADIIMRQLIKGVESIHKDNRVHRDIKPDNIFLSDDGFLKIGDFGIAKDLGKKTH